MSHVYTGFTLVLATLALATSLNIMMPEGNWLSLLVIIVSTATIVTALRNLKGR